MIDIHSHILYGIDDGAKKIEDSIKLLESAENNGVEAIFLTPHYILDSKFVAPAKVRKDILSKLKKAYSGTVKLFLGNEIYMNENIDELIQKGEISPLGDSKYLLIELPVYNEYPKLEEHLFYLKNLGYKIIIAHPERYYYFKNDFSKVIKLCKEGIYFQGNYMSLYNIYGKSTRKLFINILKHHCYTFMASDIHTFAQDYYNRISDAKRKIEKYTNKEYASCIFSANAAKIITGEAIEVEYKEKISIFDRIRGKK